jgi:cytochrome P450
VEDAGEEPLTDKFLRAQEKDPNIVGSTEVFALGLSIVGAGSGTTSISLSALFYYTLRNPTIYGKLQAETDSRFPINESNPSLYTAIPFVVTQTLPYLSAVIKESFRMHPAAAWSPERVVPPQGHTICGEHIPGGTVVGVHAWVLHRDTGIFGLDADTFRPERWLEGDSENIKRMERTLFHFGSGNYSCLGRNIAFMEMYKIVPALLRRFEISLAHPGREWKIVPGAFINVTDFDVRLATRS